MSNSYFAVGSRKRASARVWLIPGDAKTSVNKKTFEQYFGRADLVQNALEPLKVTGNLQQFSVKCKVAGGGLSAQATAVSLGAARALVIYDTNLRKPLKDAELLKRDPREHERMKYGLAKRRKRFQWTKR
ncbi:30S ribosomal protein S9 [candidate division WOR-3 bacterium JGI_Cruoil_03_51_56]|uniref:30S ribosomal protein S9 n=1 Tax=candidate division WOR-3 bacterium JGI_Cruoil_03_51_56 TaxID=1973747 RepID=A0A235BRK6_UNCW3|nr:MAG: 30S ribosomal protein S9 [candidate division WOR-3 bacterium JGI_Cruoil_03_51_56]